MTDGINAYSRPSPDGGVTVDVERMLVDLITVAKAGGHTKEQFLSSGWPRPSTK